MTKINELVLQTMLKEAVAANLRAKMESMPPEEEIQQEHPFSEHHERKMKELFSMERRQSVTRRMFLYAKTAAIIICIATTMTAALLITSPQVSAAVRNAVVSFFEGFTRVELQEPHNVVKEAQGFSPRYIPEGYELMSSEVYGLSYIIIYENVGGSLLLFTVDPPGAININNEFHNYFNVTQEGIIYHIHEASEYGYRSSIVWTDEGFMFSLLGGHAIHELLDVAYSVEHIG